MIIVIEAATERFRRALRCCSGVHDAGGCCHSALLRNLDLGLEARRSERSRQALTVRPRKQATWRLEAFQFPCPVEASGERSTYVWTHLDVAIRRRGCPAYAV